LVPQFREIIKKSITEINNIQAPNFWTVFKYINIAILVDGCLGQGGEDFLRDADDF
jgi:hypothetical protein